MYLHNFVRKQLIRASTEPCCQFVSQTPWLLCAQGAAFYFVRSAEHDIADLHRLAHDAQSKTVTTLDCSRPSHTKPTCPISRAGRY